MVCVPDAAFLLSFKGASKVYYLEQDRATSGAQQIANSKTAGYAAMAENRLHRRHFPAGNTRSSSRSSWWPPIQNAATVCGTPCAENPVQASGDSPARQDFTPEQLLYEPDLLHVRQRRTKAAFEEGLKVYQRLYQSLYQRPSGPVQPVLQHGLSPQVLCIVPTSGVPGACSLRFATPGLLPVPCLSAPIVAGHGRSPPFATGKGQGYAPAPRLASLARRFRVVKSALLSVGHSIAACHSGWRTRRCFGAIHENRLYFVSLTFMNGRKKSTDRDSPTDERLENLPVVAEIVRDDYKVIAREFRIPCGHAGFWLEALWYDAAKERWFQLGLFREVGLQTVIDLLQEALNGLDCGWRQLPAVKIGAKRYYVDERLMQLRNIDNPHEVIEVPKV